MFSILRSYAWIRSNSIRGILFVGVAILVVFLIMFHSAEAGTNDNLSGFAWSSNTGWISFNSTNQGTGANYGVTVAKNGDMSGYAWSSNIGWISFEDGDTKKC